MLLIIVPKCEIKKIGKEVGREINMSRKEGPFKAIYAPITL